MSKDHLNVFMPYQKKPLHHEDQLTRAFLILVKNVKAVEVDFYDLLITHMRDAGIAEDLIPAALSSGVGGLDSISTQVSSKTLGRVESESGRLVSVIVTDERLDPKHKVKRTDRDALYDGIVKFLPTWTFILENKPDHRNVWYEQLSSKFSENFEVEEKPVVISWRDIISRLNLLIQNGLVNDAGKALVEDFISFVWEYFPELNPYDRFELCQNVQSLLVRRCLQIMNQTGLGSVEYHRGWHDSIRVANKPGIKEITIYPEMSESTEEWELVLDLNPADILSQARDFYGTLKKDGLDSLMKKGWKLRPNFHLAYRSSGLLWVEGTINIKDYLNYWHQVVKEGNLRQIERADWNKLFNVWLKEGIITSVDRARIRTEIERKNYPNLNVCPGINMQYRWIKDDAIEIDDSGDREFAKLISKKVKEAFRLW